MVSLFCLPLVKRLGLPIALCAAGYLISFLVFTNLQLVHNYYQYENAILVIGVVVFCCADLLDQGGRPAFVGGMLALLDRRVVEVGVR